MDPDAPIVFDRALARRRLQRALTDEYPSFLLDRAVDDLDDRLAAVTRSFELGLDVGTPTAAATEALIGSLRVRAMLRLAPALPAGARPPMSAVADSEALPVAQGAFDLAVSVLSLQAVNDLPGALLQIRQSLKPDGLFLGCLLGGDTLTELRQAFAAAESELEGGASPRVAPFGEVRALGGLLQRAGFALPVADLERVTVRYGSVFPLLADLRAMGLTNALALRSRAPLRRATLLRMAAIYSERFADPDGRVRATFDMVWLSGWAPHESQQKPLRPGSARARLADALGVPELKTGDTASIRGG
jgi:SAM-dependent methyltransferase